MQLKHLNFTSLRKGISSIFNDIPDSRQQSKVSISIHDALMSGLACMYFQDPSLLQFQKRLQEEQHRDNLQTLFDVKNIPKETQMREIIDQVNSECFRPIFKDIHSRLQRGKHLTQFEFMPGFYLFPFDGTSYFYSGKIHCDKCLVRKYEKEKFELELLSHMPQETDSLATNTYYLVNNILHTSEKYLLINKFEEELWQLFYVDDDKKVLSVDISNISKLLVLLKKKTIAQLSTEKLLMQIKKILKPFYEDAYNKHKIRYTHLALQGGIMHPDQSVVIPFMPEEICNMDGENKQDCEMSAAKRLLEKVRQDHPQLGFIFCGDALFAKQTIVELILEKRAHYIFSAKPNLKRLYEWVNAQKLDELCFTDDKGQYHHYEWTNNVPLNERVDTIHTNFFRYKILSADLKIIYQNDWVTDLVITNKNIETLVRGARCRWKSENECFNVLKNHGYCLEHSYGHGEKHLGFNFYLMTLLSFFLHQIFELTDHTYQAARKKFGSKRHMWETLRTYIKIIVYETWEDLLSFALEPKRYYLTHAPPS